MMTLGVDLSANPAKTAACRVDWAAGTVELLRRPLMDDQLVEAVAAADLTGIDVPLGWPDAFVDAMVAHRDGGGWPTVTVEPPADRQPLRFRLTDLVAQQGGANPLSVSTERIGVAALRGARLQHLLGEIGVVVDRSGLSGQVIEAYPAGALRAWGLPHAGYKGSRNSQARQVLAESLSRRCGHLSSQVSACLEGCDDDDLDAVICAVIARAAVLGYTRPPAADQIDAAKREGWIHIPTASIEIVMAGGAGSAG